MTPAELIGAKVGHVMVHDARPVYLADGSVLQCSGAVDIWTEGHAIVLRSSLLYRCPPPSSAMAGRASTGAMVTVCSHEEADRLSSKLSPRMEPMLGRDRVIAAFNPTAPAFCLRSSIGQDTWITYSADLDGVWLMLARSLVAGTESCYDAGP